MTKRCHCSTKITMASLVRCSNCGEPYLDPDEAEILNEEIINIVNNEPDKFPAGTCGVSLLQVEIESNRDNEPNTQDRRTFLKVLAGGVVGTIIGGLSVEVLKPYIERQVPRYDNQITDRYYIEKSGIKLPDYALGYLEYISYISDLEYDLKKRTVIIKDQRANPFISIIQNALRDVAIGRFKSESEKVLEASVRVHNLSNKAKSSLYQKLAEIQGCRHGRVKEAIDTLNRAMVLENEEKTKSLIIRQILNQQYLSIDRDKVNLPELWIELNTTLEDGLDLIGVGKSKGDNRLEKAIRFDNVSGPGILIFEALRETAEKKDSLKEMRKAMNWHLKLSLTLGLQRPGIAWNRLTPLAAQAIDLGDLEFASKVLRIAEDPPIASMSEYANKQKKYEGAEWLLYMLMEAAWNLAAANVSNNKMDKEKYSMNSLRLLRVILKHEDRILPVLRVANLYKATAYRILGFVADSMIY